MLLINQRFTVGSDFFGLDKEARFSIPLFKILNNINSQENIKVIIRSEEDHHSLMNFLTAIGIHFFNGKVANKIDFDSSVENFGLPFCVNLINIKRTTDYYFVRERLSTSYLKELLSAPNDSFQIIDMKNK